MAETCVPSEEFGRLEACAPDDPARRHVASCARCRARYLSYLSFMEPASLPAGAEPDAARARLEELIARELGPGSLAAPVRARVVRGFFTPRRLALVLAPAACVMLLLAYRGFDRARDEVRPIVLRGGGDVPFAVEVPEVLADGSIVLSWRSVPGAGSYRVRVHDAGLRTIHESAAVADTFLVLPAAVLPAAARSDPAAPLLWRVVAMAGSAEFAESVVGTIPPR